MTEPFKQYNCIVMMEIELNEKINENKLRIAKLLEPLFVSANLTVPDRFWLSSKNLEDGYVLLYNDPLQVQPVKVLLLNTLRKYEGGDKIKTYLPGEIVDFDVVKDVLSEIDGVVSSTSPIKITYSIKKLRRNEPF